MASRNGKRKNRRNFFKKHKSQVINDFLELAARELKEVEDKLVKKVLQDGLNQNQKILFGFVEIKVRPARSGEVIVERKLNDKALKKAIEKKIGDIKKGKKNERK